MTNFADKRATNLKPDDMFYSRLIVVDDIPTGELQEIKSDKPIQVRVNNGEWITIDPSDL
jgi:hypothetical protein